MRMLKLRSLPGTGRLTRSGRVLVVLSPCGALARALFSGSSGCLTFEAQPCRQKALQADSRQMATCTGLFLFLFF